MVIGQEYSHFSHFSNPQSAGRQVKAFVSVAKYSGVRGERPSFQWTWQQPVPVSLALDRLPNTVRRDRTLAELTKWLLIAGLGEFGIALKAKFANRLIYFTW